MPQSIIENFVAKIEVDAAGCWRWVGAINSGGYGSFAVHRHIVSAHRWAYERWIGPIPVGLEIDHLCRNRACVNPAHLEAVTRKENVKRGISFGAVNMAKTHCVKGHAFTPDNTYMRPNGARQCRVCNAESARAYRQRNLEAA